MYGTSLALSSHLTEKQTPSSSVGLKATAASPVGKVFNVLRYQDGNRLEQSFTRNRSL